MCRLCVFALRRQSLSKGDSLLLNTSESVQAGIEESPHQIKRITKLEINLYGINNNQGDLTDA